jgi:glycosyltransferase involved in cell wall biosynthesis
LFNLEQREARRNNLRRKLNISRKQFVVGFFGKLIPKKEPTLLLEALPYLSPALRDRLALLFVGSGELQERLETEAANLQASYGVPAVFPGFVNQSTLVDWYLAADVVVLPSRRAGETWGLVVNEAMQAGCGVVVSDAVGSSADFRDWERFRSIPVGSPKALAMALNDLAVYPRSFTWAADRLKDYSIDAAAQALAAAIAELP